MSSERAHFGRWQLEPIMAANVQKSGQHTGASIRSESLPPPLAEQKRIVAKVDRLMGLVGRVGGGVGGIAARVGEALLEAVVAELTAVVRIDRRGRRSHMGGRSRGRGSVWECGSHAPALLPGSRASRSCRRAFLR